MNDNFVGKTHAVGEEDDHPSFKRGLHKGNLSLLTKDPARRGELFYGRVI